jgi:hypothetical protein
MATLVSERSTIPYGCEESYQLPKSKLEWPETYELSDNISSFEDELVSIVGNYVGQSVANLYLNFGVNPKAKSANACLVKAILGNYSRAVALIEASGIQIKTIQLKSNGTPKESMSFPSFRFSEIVQEEWDEIDEDSNHFRNQISGRFMFVVFQCKHDCKSGDYKILKGIKFWNMPSDDLETVRKVWESTKGAVIQSNSTFFPKLKDKNIIHVRPHGTKKCFDVLPNGKSVRKRSFWLNALYIKSLL